jgi:hypothetical protein
MLHSRCVVLIPAFYLASIQAAKVIIPQFTPSTLQDFPDHPSMKKRRETQRIQCTQRSTVFGLNKAPRWRATVWHARPGPEDHPIPPARSDCVVRWRGLPRLWRRPDRPTARAKQLKLIEQGAYPLGTGAATPPSPTRTPWRRNESPECAMQGVARGCQPIYSNTTPAAAAHCIPPPPLRHTLSPHRVPKLWYRAYAIADMEPTIRKSPKALRVLTPSDVASSTMASIPGSTGVGFLLGSFGLSFDYDMPTHPDHRQRRRRATANGLLSLDVHR